MGANRVGDDQPTANQRLFLALFPPPAAAEHVAQHLRALPSCRQGDLLRLVPADRLHVTLAFLGAVPAGGRRAALHHELTASITAFAPPRPLQLAGSGCFGDSVGWIGLVGPRSTSSGPPESLARDVRTVKRACRAARCPPDDGRPWQPHLTVARAGRSGGTQPMARTEVRAEVRAALRLLAAELADYAGPEWLPDRYSLVASSGGPRPRYERLADYPLPGP